MPFLVVETLGMGDTTSLVLVTSYELTVVDDASSMSQTFDAASSIIFG